MPADELKAEVLLVLDEAGSGRAEAATHAAATHAAAPQHAAAYQPTRRDGLRSTDIAGDASFSPHGDRGKTSPGSSPSSSFYGDRGKISPGSSFYGGKVSPGSSFCGIAEETPATDASLPFEAGGVTVPACERIGLDSLKLVRRIGAGAMGTMYLARWVPGDRLVALKAAGGSEHYLEAWLTTTYYLLLTYYLLTTYLLLTTY